VITETALVHCALISARCFGALLFLPGSEPISFMSKIGLSLVLAGLLGAPESTVVISWEAVGAFALLSEIMTGIVLSLPVTAAIDGIGSLGEYFDSIRGQTAGNLHDPLTMNLASLSSTLLRNGFVATLCVNGGLVTAIEVLHDLSDALPPGTPTAFFAPDAIRRFLTTYSRVFGLFLLPALGCLAIEMIGAFVAKSSRGAAQTELLYCAKILLGSFLIIKALSDLDPYGVWKQ
jgi:type III secretory pathway component EscT